MLTTKDDSGEPPIIGESPSNLCVTFSFHIYGQETGYLEVVDMGRGRRILATEGEYTLNKWQHMSLLVDMDANFELRVSRMKFSRFINEIKFLN